MILIVCFLVYFQSNKAAEEIALAKVKDVQTPIEVVAEIGKNTSFQRVRDAAIQRLTKHHDELASKLKRSVNPDETEEDIKAVDNLKPQLSPILADEFDRLREQARLQQRQQRLKQVQAEFAGKTSSFSGSADRFILDFPDGDEANTVKQLKVEWHLDRRADGRREIRGMVVAKPGDLFDKQRRIEEYLKEFAADESKSDVVSMRRAAELSRNFYETHTYKVTLKQSGGLPQGGIVVGKRYHVVKFFRDVDPVHNVQSKDAASEITWSAETFQLEWKSGQSIRIELWDAWTALPDGKVGTTDDHSLVALSLLGGKTKMKVDPNYTSVVREPFVSCVVEGISAEDWEAFRRFITPGDGWK